MADSNGGTFGAVNGRAAAHSNQTIAAIGFVNSAGSSDSRLCGVGRCFIKYSHLHARKRIQCLLQNACRLDALVGDDQGLVNANPFTFLFQKLNGAEIDLNLGDVIDKGHDDSGGCVTMMHHSNASGTGSQPLQPSISHIGDK